MLSPTAWRNAKGFSFLIYLGKGLLSVLWTLIGTGWEIPKGTKPACLGAGTSTHLLVVGNIGSHQL